MEYTILETELVRSSLPRFVKIDPPGFALSFNSAKLITDRVCTSGLEWAGVNPRQLALVMIRISF